MIRASQKITINKVTMEDVKQKILVVIEAYTLSDNEERNQDELTDLIANAVQNQGFDVDIECK